ncbi:MAG TPA: hypothetical protein VK469_04065, partial [Candidatus Kapabacteria bacterium]|nr:hypothetical protein [Candidatus Kapabacteria bacterium]
KYRFFVFKKYSLASSVKCLRPFFNDFIYKKVLDKVGAKLYNILNPVPQKYQVRVKIIKKKLKFIIGVYKNVN